VGWVGVYIADRCVARQAVISLPFFIFNIILISSDSDILVVFGIIFSIAFLAPFLLFAQFLKHIIRVKGRKFKFIFIEESYWNKKQIKEQYECGYYDNVTYSLSSIGIPKISFGRFKEKYKSIINVKPIKIKTTETFVEVIKPEHPVKLDRTPKIKKETIPIGNIIETLCSRSPTLSDRFFRRVFLPIIIILIVSVSFSLFAIKTKSDMYMWIAFGVPRLLDYLSVGILFEYFKSPDNGLSGLSFMFLPNFVILYLAYFFFIRKWYTRSFFSFIRCPKCDNSIRVYYNWTCDFCKHTQGKDKIIFSKCNKCHRTLGSYVCEHCNAEIGIW